jgi:hypothetical protein
MLRSFVQRLFGQRKHDKDAESLCFKGPANERELPGPILSILSTRRFNSLFLFDTRRNRLADELGLASHWRECYGYAWRGVNYRYFSGGGRHESG